MSEVNMDELVWKLFDQLHTDVPIPGQERYNPQAFKRKFVNFRFADVPGKIVTLNDKFELPTGSILHLADNFFHPEDMWTDTPTIEGNIFLEQESFKKFIYHVRDFSLKEPILLEDKYIYRPAGLPTKLMAFRSQQGSNFRYVNTISELPTKKECLIVINHNPLFRAKLMGRLQFFRRTELILTSILNTCSQLKDFGKQQFILLPWGTEVYDKSEFVKSRSALTPASLRHPESIHWLLQMHLLNYMWEGAVTSVFSKVPEDLRPQITLVIQNHDKYLFHNLQTMLYLNPKNRLYFKFANQLNMLSVLGRVDDDKLHPDTVKKFTSVLDKIGIFKKEPNIDVQVTTPEEQVVKSTYDTQDETGVDTPDEKVEEAIKKLDTEVIPKKKFNPVKGLDNIRRRQDPQALSPNVSIEVPDVEPEFDPDKINAVHTAHSHNSTSVQKGAEEHNARFTEDFLRDLEADTDDYISRNPDLTPGQKERYKKLSRKWKEVSLSGVKMEELIKTSNDISLDHEILDKKQIGDIPDDSALKSSLSAFDKDYMSKTYKKQLASILIAFQKNGIFLTGIKEQKVITEMNNLTKYSVQYEDIRGNKTTIKFSLPTVNRNGRVKMDGVEHVCKKQKINLPIVKINDTTISLASNQNKTRVERNTNKAHNFLAFVESILNSPKTNISVEYGKSFVNLPISYEYDAIGEKYKAFEFFLNGDINSGIKYQLYFEYATRAEHFGGDIKILTKLEQLYGVYFGQNKDSWFFVDSQNRVRAVLKSGGENFQVSQLDSIIAILKLSLLPGESINKVLTEWVSVKILDAYLPVIFLLGYRYGLRHMLDYLRVDYTITERRSKIIVGEGNLAAQESYNLYHMTGAHDNVKRLGLLSERSLYEKDRQSFHAITFIHYRERASKFLKKPPSQITDEDIIKYLDEGRKPLSADDIWFSFIPSSEMPYIRYGNAEYKVPFEVIEKYAIGKPIITFKKKYEQVTWNELKNRYQKLVQQATKGAQIPIGENDLKYRHIIHCAIPCKPIPYRELILIDQNIPGQESFNIMERSKLREAWVSSFSFDWIKNIVSVFIDSYKYLKKVHQVKQGKEDRVSMMLDVILALRKVGKPIIGEKSVINFITKYLEPRLLPYEEIHSLEKCKKDMHSVYGRDLPSSEVESILHCPGQCIYGSCLTAVNRIKKEHPDFFRKQVGSDYLTYFDKYIVGHITYRPFLAAKMFQWFTLTDKALEAYCEVLLAHERRHAGQNVDKLVEDILHPLYGSDYDYMDTEYDANGIALQALYSYVNQNDLNKYVNGLVPGTASWDEEMFGANVHNVTPAGEDPLEGTDWIKIAGQEALSWGIDVNNYTPGMASADTKSNVEVKVKRPEKINRASLNIPNKPILSTGLINGLDQIKELNVPNTDLIVGASASMILYGIKDTPNRDLDCGISPEWLQKLEDQGLIEMVEEPSGWHKRIKGSEERGCEIDFGVWSADGKIPAMPWEEHHSGTVVVDDVRFDNIYEMFRFYTWLLEHAKNEAFVAKRTRQLKELSEAVSNWFDHKAYHAGPVQGITTLQARVAPSYKSRGPLVFATYFKHFAMCMGFKWNDEMIRQSWTIAADGLTPIITMDIQKPLQEAELRCPYSIYTVPDADFRHLLHSTEDPDNFGGHPIVEIIHSGDVDVTHEELRDDWWGDLLQLEELQLVKIEHKELVQKPVIKMVHGLQKVEDNIFGDEVSVTLDTDRVEDTPGLPVREEKKFTPKSTSIPIKFADRILWIDRYPLAHSLIFAGLDNFDLSSYEMSQFESKDVYYHLLQNKNMSINYLKGIDTFFDTFLDPITYHTLKMMNEPTNMKDLLIRCVVLLTTMDHLPAASSKNFRIRGYEQFLGILYNELARQYATYSKGRGRANVFTIPEEAVLLRILQNSSLLPSEPGNPLKDFAENAYFTYLGFGGRTAVSFVASDRKMALDDTGVMSEATPDNANVGVNGHLTYDPGIQNTLGIIDPKPIPELTPGNCFSLHVMCFPYSTSDDSKRIFFCY